MSPWITTCVDHIATARSRHSYLRAVPYLLMGWSGHAHARSAIEADKGHQRRRARHVAVGSLADISQCNRRVRFTPKSGHSHRAHSGTRNTFRSMGGVIAARWFHGSPPGISSFSIQPISPAEWVNDQAAYRSAVISTIVALLGGLRNATAEEIDVIFASVRSNLVAEAINGKIKS